ncbi:MAG: DUF29 domain-containing protein [Cyanothece sp. SIO1E1]|nr:DUF29 domain-containing protein [Cyanothece sp. SIO1E1]
MPSNQGDTQRPVKDHQTSHGQSYETDFVVWAESMAELLRMKRFDEFDLENLIDEVQDLSNFPTSSPYTIEQTLDPEYLP